MHSSDAVGGSQLPVSYTPAQISLMTNLIRKRPILLWNAILILPAAVSLCVGVFNALSPAYSKDFQWSGTHLTLLHIDPYRQFLLHDPGHLLVRTQVPNYLHELYILLLPLGALSFSSAWLVWLILNCLFAAIVLLVLRKIYSLDNARTLLLTSLLLASTPFRIAVAAGTESLLELLLFCLFFHFEGEIKRGIVLGLSYSKYSFSPVLFFYLFFRRRYRILAISLIPPVLGLIFMWLLVKGSLITLALEPLRVSRTGVSPGLADLMLIVHAAFDRVVQNKVASTIAYSFALIASALYAFFLSRRKDLSLQDEFASIAIGSLIFFPHLTYDFVFLIVPVAACLAGAISRVKVIVLCLCGLSLFAVKFLFLLGNPLPKTYVSFTVLLVLSAMLLMLGRPDFAQAIEADAS